MIQTRMSYQIDREYWAKLTIFEQMGNIGSEVGRSFTAKSSGDSKRFKGAFMRALDLFSATIEVLIMRQPHRVREVEAARGEFLRVIHDIPDTIEEESLKRYFDYFAIAARSDR